MCIHHLSRVSYSEYLHKASDALPGRYSNICVCALFFPIAVVSLENYYRYSEEPNLDEDIYTIHALGLGVKKSGCGEGEIVWPNVFLEAVGDGGESPHPTIIRYLVIWL